MKQPIPSDLQEAFAQVLAQLRQSFGEDLIGVYALVQDQPHIIAVTETAMSDEQRASLSTGYEESLNRDIGLTVFTREQLQEGHPYESDFAYDANAKPVADDSERALSNTARLRVLRHHGYALAGETLSSIIPTVTDDDYRVVLRHEANRRLPQMRADPTGTILNLCRILAFWRIGLVLPTEDAGAWSIKNLDPRFQNLIERAATEYHSGAEPGAYNAYQLDQFAEYVRDMLLR